MSQFKVNCNCQRPAGNWAQSKKLGKEFMEERSTSPSTWMFAHYRCNTKSLTRAFISNVQPLRSRARSKSKESIGRETSTAAVLGDRSNRSNAEHRGRVWTRRGSHFLAGNHECPLDRDKHAIKFWRSNNLERQNQDACLWTELNWQGMAQNMPKWMLMHNILSVLENDWMLQV